MFRSSLCALTLALCGTPAVAQPDIDWGFGRYGNNYEVTITNLTPGQAFTPQLLLTHAGRVQLFELGEPAGDSLEMLAEGGNTAPLTDELENVADEVKTVDGLLFPGQSVTTTISASRSRRYLSMAAMLLPTNDTFVALNRAKLPSFGSVEYMVPAYDAGTEANDQDCASIPGPDCGGEGYNGDAAPGDEGFIHISNGFHDLGDSALSPKMYDWRNPVARVTVTRVK